MDIDAFIDGAFKALADISEAVVFYAIDLKIGSGDELIVIPVPLILIWLAAASIFFTLYLGFINIRYFKHSFDVLRGKYDDNDADGEIGNWQALAASLAGTVGLGNIAGVAVAVSIGGPGAVLWMTIMGFLGMSTKFVEVTLGVKYRHHADPQHPAKISGGPMYYLRDGFSNRNIPYIGTFLAALFSVLCIGGAIGGGNMFQANQAFEQVLSVTGGDTGFMAGKGWLFGLVLAFFVGIVIIGGIKSIANVSSMLVPIMGGLYLIAGLVIIAMNYQDIPYGFGVIFSDALTMQAGLGGFLGGLLAGVQRASFSNEAGLGSAPIVHSTVKTNQPVGQGILGMLGPFIDTIVICTVTALVIVFSGVYETGQGIEGVELTSRAMGEHISWMPNVLVFVVVLFAYSTLLTWYYLGEKAFTFLFGEKDWLIFLFKIIFCAFVVVGAAAELKNVIRFTDAMILSMAIPNIIGLYFLAPEVKREVKKYREYIDEMKKKEAQAIS